MWCADIEKWVADLAVEGLLFVKVSTKLDIHSLLTGSAAGPLAWSEIDPAHRAFDARGPTIPNFQRPDRAGQRCKCRLVCKWVCTVTSVSVRIEKRANCAKNNKPKSGGLFLVNARPFPEHSSSRATFSAGRAWLEAILGDIQQHTHACGHRILFSVNFGDSVGQHFLGIAPQSIP